MSKDETFIMELVKFSTREAISILRENENGDPSLKVVEAIVIKYGVHKEGAWSLYRPIFWYLSRQKVISVDNSGCSLHPGYQNPSEDTLDELVNGVVHSYKDTLNARIEKYHNNKY